MNLNDYISFSKTHGRDSARFLTKYKGNDIYVGTRADNRPRIIGYPLLMTERKGQIIALNHKEILRVLATLPDED